MVLITLLGEEQAVVGRTFVYLGPDHDCRYCQLKDVCFNLEKGGMYKVKSLRKTTHECEATENIVHVVEVEKVPRDVSVERRYAVDGSTVTFLPSKCGNIGCRNYKFCNPQGMDGGIRVKIIKVGEKSDCPMGGSRNRVTVL